MTTNNINLGNFASEEAAIEAVKAASGCEVVRTFLHGYNPYENGWDSFSAYAGGYEASCEVGWYPTC